MPDEEQEEKQGSLKPAAFQEAAEGMNQEHGLIKLENAVSKTVGSPGRS